MTCHSALLRFLRTCQVFILASSWESLYGPGLIKIVFRCTHLAEGLSEVYARYVESVVAAKDFPDLVLGVTFGQGYYRILACVPRVVRDSLGRGVCRHSCRQEAHGE